MKKPKTTLNELLSPAKDEVITEAIPEAVSETVEEPVKAEEKPKVNEFSFDLAAVKGLVNNYTRQGYKAVWCGEDAPDEIKELVYEFNENETESLLVLATPGFEKIEEKLNKCNMDHYHLVKFNADGYNILFVKL
jgi:hypothetical protein